MSNIFRDVEISEEISQNHFFFQSPLQQDANSTGLYSIVSNREFFALPHRGTCHVFKHEHGVYGKRIVDEDKVFKCHKKGIREITLSLFQNIFLTAPSTSDEVVKLWKIPDPFEKCVEKEQDSYDMTSQDNSTVQHMAFHPTTQEVFMCSVSAKKIYFLDMIKKERKIVINADTVSQNCCFNENGENMLSSNSDGSVSIYDIRANEPKIAEILNAHPISRGLSSFYVNSDIILTSGMNKEGCNVLKLWDIRKLDEEVDTLVFDDCYGNFINLFDNGLKLLYSSVKNEGSVYITDISDGKLKKITHYYSPVPTRGICMLPKTSLNTLEHEIARFLKVTRKSVISLKCNVPQEGNLYVPKLYPDIYFANREINTSDVFFDKTSKLKILPKCSLNPNESFQIGWKKRAKQESKEKKNKEEIYELDKKSLIEKIKVLEKKVIDFNNFVNMKKYNNGEKEKFEKQIQYLINDNNSNTKSTLKESESKEEVSILKNEIKRLKEEKDINFIRYKSLMEEKVKSEDDVFFVGKRQWAEREIQLKKKNETLLMSVQKLERKIGKIIVYYEERNHCNTNGIDISSDINDYLKEIENQEQNEKSELHEILLEEVARVDKDRRKYEENFVDLQENIERIKKSFESKLDNISTEYTSQIDVKNKRISQLEKEYEYLDALLIEKKVEIEELQEKTEEKDGFIKKLKESLLIEEDKCDDLIEKKANLEIELKKKISLIEKEKVINDGLVSKTKQKYEGLKEKFRKLRDEYRKGLEKITILTEENEKIKQKNITLEKEKKERKEKKKNMNVSLKKMNQLEKENMELKTINEDLNAKIEELQKVKPKPIEAPLEKTDSIILDEKDNIKELLRINELKIQEEERRLREEREEEQKLLNEIREREEKQKQIMEMERLRDEKREKERKEKEKEEERKKKKILDGLKHDLKKLETKEKHLRKYSNSQKRRANRNFKEKKDGWKDRESELLVSIGETAKKISMVQVKKREVIEKIRKFDPVYADEIIEEEKIEQELRELERKKRERFSKQKNKIKKKSSSSNNSTPKSSTPSSPKSLPKTLEISKTNPIIDSKKKSPLDSLKDIHDNLDQKEKMLKEKIDSLKGEKEFYNSLKNKKKKDKEKLEDIMIELIQLEDEYEKLEEEKKQLKAKIDDEEKDQKKNEIFSKPEKPFKASRMSLNELRESRKGIISKRNEKKRERRLKEKEEREKRIKEKEKKKSPLIDFSKLTKEEVEFNLKEIKEEQKNLKLEVSEYKNEIERYKIEKPQDWKSQERNLILKKNACKAKFKELEKDKKKLENYKKKLKKKASKRKSEKDKKRNLKEYLEKHLSKEKKKPKKEIEEDKEVEKEIQKLEKKKRERYERDKRRKALRERRKNKKNEK